MTSATTRPRSTQLVSGLVLACLALWAGPARATAATPAPEARGSAPKPSVPEHWTRRKVSPYRKSSQLTQSAETHYVAAWGVDRLKVTYTSSGNLIRFSYRVSDPQRAKVLADKGATPYLLGVKSRALLQVPVMDNVGQLRQAAAPRAGKEYWMVFSNKGNLVKPGDRVDVMIGTFRAEGLVVEGS